MTHGRRTARLARSPRGFTLLELLVVISIIVALAALATGAGVLVVKRNKSRVTENLLSTLDRALEEYIAVNSVIPKYVPEAHEGVPGPDNELEQYRQREHMRRPDAAVFLRQAVGIGQVDSILGAIPERFLFATPLTTGNGGGAIEPDDTTPSIIDGWGTPGVWPPIRVYSPYSISMQQVIYYVHPDNELAQDLYGRCVNRRPYFMSAGPDEKYGLSDEFMGDEVGRRALAEQALADNLYSYEGVSGTHLKEMTER